MFETDEMLCLNSQFGKSEILDLVPSFAKDFIKTRMDIKEEKKVFIQKMDAGYSHAIFLDYEGIVYVFGAGHYGQLGLGFEEIKAKKPIILQELNDGFDKITTIA